MLIERDKRRRLARELAKLDRADEQRLAEEGLGDKSWSQLLADEISCAGLHPVGERKQAGLLPVFILGDNLSIDDPEP